MAYTENERRILDKWPKFEDGTYVMLGDKAIANSGENSGKEFTVRNVYFESAHGKLRSSALDGCYWNWKAADPYVKRPAPKVLDADGVEIKVGDTVYDTELVNGDKFTVESIDKNGDVRARGGKCILTQSSVAFTHMQPAIDADGVLIEVGDKVWGIGDINPATVVEVDGDAVHVQYFDGFIFEHKAAQLSHERHDSWERLEEDARQLDINLNDTTDDYPRMNFARGLIRRAKVLAEKEAAR